MIFAYNWAKKNKIKLNGFDSRLNSFKRGKNKGDNNKLIEEQQRLMKDFNWKDMNKAKNLKILNIDFKKRIIDPEKEAKRESEMLKNIKKVMIKEGLILIITGCGHLDFFEKKIKTAIFPFR